MSELPDDLADWEWTVSHTVEFKINTTWSRTNSMSWRYYEIAEGAYVKFLQEKQNPIPDPGPEEDPGDYFAHTERMLNAAIQTIVFSAMACEAAIYDLAAIHLGDKYAGDVLDKLDVVAKWLVVPQLICGRSMRESGPAINGLRALIPTRNSLVHSKSLPGITDPSDYENLKARHERGRKQFARIIDGATTAMQTMILLSLELSRLLGTRAGVLPMFESDKEPYEWNPEPAVVPLIHRCREIDRAASTKLHR